MKNNQSFSRSASKVKGREYIQTYLAMPTIILLQKVDKDPTRKWKATVLYEHTDRNLTQSSGYTNSVIHEDNHSAPSIDTTP